MLALAFGLNHEQYVTLLPKSITTAIGMGVSEELHGITTITVAVIIVTGVLGNVIAELVFKIFRIQEPIAKGLALEPPPMPSALPKPWNSARWKEP